MQPLNDLNTVIHFIIDNKCNNVEVQECVETGLVEEMLEFSYSIGESFFERNIISKINTYKQNDCIRNNCFNCSIDYSKIKNWIEIQHVDSKNIIRLFLCKDEMILSFAFYTRDFGTNKKDQYHEEFLATLPRNALTMSHNAANFYNFLKNGSFFQNQKPYHTYH